MSWYLKKQNLNTNTQYNQDKQTNSSNNANSLTAT
jgi:hypothetical protein